MVKKKNFRYNPADVQVVYRSNGQIIGKSTHCFIEPALHATQYRCERDAAQINLKQTTDARQADTEEDDAR